VDCGRCGARFKAGLRICPECGATVPRPRIRFGAVRCAGCQERVPSGLRVCPYCGRELRRSWLPAVLVVAAVLFLAGAWYAGLHYVPWQEMRARLESIRIPEIRFLPTPTFGPPASVRTPTTESSSPAPFLSTRTPVQPAMTPTPQPVAAAVSE